MVLLTNSTPSCLKWQIVIQRPSSGSKERTIAAHPVFVNRELSASVDRVPDGCRNCIAGSSSHCAMPSESPGTLGLSELCLSMLSSEEWSIEMHILVISLHHRRNSPRSLNRDWGNRARPQSLAPSCFISNPRSARCRRSKAWQRALMMQRPCLPQPPLPLLPLPSASLPFAHVEAYNSRTSKICLSPLSVPRPPHLQSKPSRKRQPVHSCRQLSPTLTLPSLL